VWQAVLIDDEGVERFATRLLADVLVDFVRTQVLHGDGIVDRLAARLDRERVVGISKL
jgi:hypothetical protein